METSNKLLPVWCIEDPAHPKPTHSCEPSPPFLSPSWASQSVHILMVFIWSRLLSIKMRQRSVPVPWGRSASTVLDCARSPQPFTRKFRAWSNSGKSCFIVLQWLHGFKMAIYHTRFCFLWRGREEKLFCLAILVVWRLSFGDLSVSCPPGTDGQSRNGNHGFGASITTIWAGNLDLMSRCVAEVGKVDVGRVGGFLRARKCYQ